jgi:hypothetical protein
MVFLVQRVVGSIRRMRADGEVVLKNIMGAAGESGRTFAIETLNVKAQPGYQRHNGRPVLSVWGMGLSDGNAHPPADPQAAKAMIDWFESRRRRIIMGGIPSRWRTASRDARVEPACSRGPWAATLRPRKPAGGAKCWSRISNWRRAIISFICR